MNTAVVWFGAYDAARFNYDRDQVFGAIVTHMGRTTFRADCFASECRSNIYAYVYPNDATFTIHFCKVFFDLPGERVQTIVHELSHFNSLGKTNDYKYGEGPCKQLARDNPTQASHNADNVCYFAAYAT